LTEIHRTERCEEVRSRAWERINGVYLAVNCMYSIRGYCPTNSSGNKHTYWHYLLHPPENDSILTTETTQITIAEERFDRV